jgi:hypothetical protein
VNWAKAEGIATPCQAVAAVCAHQAGEGTALLVPQGQGAPAARETAEEAQCVSVWSCRTGQGGGDRRRIAEGDDHMVRCEWKMPRMWAEESFHRILPR